jgi:HK97 gp10 family phage protein
VIKIDSHVEGLAEMEAFLRTLPDDIARKMLRSSLMGAARPIMRQAQANVQQTFGNSPRYTGTLAAGIVRGRAKTGLAARVDVKLKKPRSKAKATVNGVKKQSGDDPFYGRFLEFGTSKMPARPFLKPAGMAKQDEAGREMNKALAKQIAKWCKANGVKYRPGDAT